MSALDRLQNYSARPTNPSTISLPTMFVNNTVEDVFLERVHRSGYKLFNVLYKNSDGETITEEEYNSLSEEDKGIYTIDFEPTELLNLLRTYGNQEINAIAGAGKTSALVFKVMYDVVTGEATRLYALNNGNQVRIPDKIWVCTF